MKRGGESRSRTGTAERTRQNGERTAGCSRVVKDTFLQVARVGPALEFLEGVGRTMDRQCLRRALDHRGRLLVVVGGRPLALLLCGGRLGL